MEPLGGGWDLAVIDNSVRPPARIGALVALVVTAVAVILFWSADGGGQSASAVTTASVNLDAVSDGANTATSVGTIDSCRALASGETAVLDLVIQDVSGLAGFEVDLVYDPAVVRVVTLTANIEVDYEFLLAPVSTSVIELGDALPDDGSGTFKLGAAQFPSSPVSGSGVLARFKIEAVGSGLTDIALTGVKLSDGTGTPIPPSDTSNVYQGPISGATITVDGSCGDIDGDGVPDESDNCPRVATPWLVPAGDTDCDGWTDSIEAQIGTDGSDRCADTAAPNDEPLPNVWPVDFNDDQIVTGSDILKFGAVFGSSAPGPPYDVRYDFNVDGWITGADILKFGRYFGESCT